MRGTRAAERPRWPRQHAEKHLGAGPFVAGAENHVVDVKLHMPVRWSKSGTVDHVAATVFDAYPRLSRLHVAAESHPRLKAWTVAHRPR